MNLDVGEQQKYSKAVMNLIEKVNSGDKMGVDWIIEGIEKDFLIKDCIDFLKKSGMKMKDVESCYYKLREKRNDIVHRGNMADFEDYANAFIIIGNLFNIYKIEKWIKPN